MNFPGGCLGCLPWVMGVALWALVALLPLTFMDDLVGPVLKAHWPIFPVVQGHNPDRYTQHVTVPSGSRMSLSVDEVADDLVPDPLPPVQCSIRDGGSPWLALPAHAVPVVPARKANGDQTDLKMVRFENFVTRSGDLSVRCTGSQVVELRSEDPGVRRRFQFVLVVAKVLWPVAVTAVLIGPILLFRSLRRRRRRI